MSQGVPQPIGDRDRPVTIQQLTDGIAASRVPTESWTTLVDLEWMAKNDLSGRERFQYGELSAAADTRFEMAYRPDMDPELINIPKRRRLLYLDRPYDIVSARMIGLREAVELTCLSKAG